MRGLVLLAAGVVAASFGPILLRLATDAEPLALALWRCAAAALVLAPFARSALRQMSARELSLCALSGVFLAVHFATWITSLELTTVATSVLLVSTAPIFVALVAPWIVSERLTSLGWAGIAAALAGTTLIAGIDVGESSPGGNALALIGGATAGGYVLTGRVARRTMAAVPYSTATYGVSAVLLAVMCAAATVPLAGYSAGTWWAIAGLIVGPQLLGHTVINNVLSGIDATTVSVSLMAEPIIAAAAAALLFDEIPPFVFYPGAVAILGGIYLVSTHQRAAVVPVST